MACRTGGREHGARAKARRGERAEVLLPQGRLSPGRALAARNTALDAARLGRKLARRAQRRGGFPAQGTPAQQLLRRGAAAPEWACVRVRRGRVRRVHAPGDLPRQGTSARSFSLRHAVRRLIGAAGRIQSDSFPGLLGLVYSYLETLDVEPSELHRIHEYLDLVKDRASGEKHCSFPNELECTHAFIPRSPDYSGYVDTQLCALSPGLQTRFCRLTGDQLRPVRGDRRDVSAHFSSIVPVAQFLTSVISERGVRQAPDMLPACYSPSRASYKPSSPAP